MHGDFPISFSTDVTLVFPSSVTQKRVLATQKRLSPVTFARLFHIDRTKLMVARLLFLLRHFRCLRLFRIFRVTSRVKKKKETDFARATTSVLRFFSRSSTLFLFLFFWLFCLLFKRNINVARKGTRYAECDHFFIWQDVIEDT